jgi:hypothetical protein
VPVALLQIRYAGAGQFGFGFEVLVAITAMQAAIIAEGVVNDRTCTCRNTVFVQRRVAGGNATTVSRQLGRDRSEIARFVRMS